MNDPSKKISLYDFELLCREQLVAAASPELDIPQLRESSKASLRNLEGIPFVLPTCGPYFDPLISKTIEKSRARLDISIRDCSPDLALEIVSNGLGIAIVPSTSLSGKRGLRTFELSDMSAGNALRYVRRNDRPVSEEEKLFVDILHGFLTA